ncbi:MAG TPA: hypothetical protein VGN83_01035 [Falsiroseomonas sp.]|jgi:hypothetical protein|nr:hypothetical protein [Falsiroseomonas sp.]
MPSADGRYRILFGDIHNHNGHGYGVGSIERTIEIARTHLDFFAFTGHMQWHDMEPMEGGREQHWLKGFARLRETWPRVQNAIAEANRDGEFSAFLGFEWHSSQYGDQCVVFPQDHRPLHEAPDVPSLRRFCVAEDALMIPHHLAYPSGMRGVNWGVFCERCTPVVEIYSEHGNSEDDRGPLPMFSHSMGGRQTSNTVRAALEQGLRFGFVASSDNHAGFPGAYGEGLMGALCTDLTRPAILEAIRARRTYALTGDRIELDFAVEGAPMGSTIEAGGEVEVAYSVRGRDELDLAEVIQDGEVVHRSFVPEATPPDALDGPVQIRLEWGWGPWGALALQRICDWRFQVMAAGAQILRVFPCLQSGPYDEERRHRFTLRDPHHLAVQSFTSRREAYRENPNQSVVLELDGPSDATLRLRLEAPVMDETVSRLGDLLAASHNLRTGPFPRESYQWHRIVPRSASALEDRCRLRVPPGRRSHVYLRVRQKNGHMAWASPVFLNHR